MIVLSLLHIEDTIEFCIIVIKSKVLRYVSNARIQVYECLHRHSFLMLEYKISSFTGTLKISRCYMLQFRSSEGEFKKAR